MEENKIIKIFNEQEINFQQEREIVINLVEIIKENNLSLNQAVQILDLTKEILSKKPLWN